FQAITTVRFAASEGLDVRSIPGGDEAGTGSQSFTIGEASFDGGEVTFAGLPGAYASAPSAYFVGAVGSVTFSSPVDRARFFFVHMGGQPQTATALDANGNVVAVVNSRAATTLGDPANFVVLAGAAPIASIQISGGMIDNFAFVA
ncbi:MAG: hypothetical protein MI861_10070, partial [Pirellulales bacterium]|nr:hypothetical protein [Pirellulales bacterium]